MLASRTRALAAALCLILGAFCLRQGGVQVATLPVGDAVRVVCCNLVYLAAFALVIAGVLLGRGAVPSARPQKWTTRMLPCVAVVAIVLVEVVRRYGVRYIGTDAVAFSRYAIELLLHGENPYAHTLRPALDLYPLDHAYLTYRIDGSLVTQLSYPAMSVLAFIPEALLGNDSLQYTSLLALTAACCFIVTRARGWLRWLPAALLVTHNEIVRFSGGGIFDVLWVPPMLVTMFGMSRGRVKLAGIAYGIACSVKPTPWLVAPFIAVWLWHERRELARFLGYAALAFFVINAPFAMTAPADWVRGVLTPVLGGAPLVELGEGPILYNMIGVTQLPKAFFALLMGLAFIVCACAYAVWFDRAKWLAWIAPMVILWFNQRSLHNYYLFSLPLAAYALVLAGEDAPPEAARRVARWFPLVVAAALVVSVLAFVLMRRATRLPLDIQVLSLDDTAGTARIDQMTVRLTNNGDASLSPVFATTRETFMTPIFWRAADPRDVAPGETRQLTITAPVAAAAISVEESAQLRVYDRGHERWATAPIVPAWTASRTLPLIRNQHFAEPALRFDSGLPVPLTWDATPGRYPPWGSYDLDSDGVHISSRADEAHRDREIGLAQMLPALPRAITVRVTPQVVPGTDHAELAAGIELLAGRSCIVAYFVDIDHLRVFDSERRKRECRAAYVPARAAEAQTIALDLADIAPPSFRERFAKRNVRLKLFPGAPLAPGGITSIVFHEVSTADVATYTLRQLRAMRP